MAEQMVETKDSSREQSIYGNTEGNAVATSTNPNNPGGGFSFLFDYTAENGKEVIKTVKDDTRNLYVTRISNYNKYYFKHGKNNGVIEGANGAIAINNEEIVGSKFKTSSDYKNARKLKKYPTIANCVGWAHGRVLEIWAMAKKSGYIKKEGGKWIIPSNNNREVEGPEPTYKLIPVSMAYTFISNWPNKTGWYISKDYTPKPGAIVCWKSTNSSGSPGHVAVVEAVYDLGKKTEYIIISEGSYNKDGVRYLGRCRRINRGSMKNGKPYGDYGLELRGFLISPVCQLSTTQVVIPETPIPIEDLTDEEREKMEDNLNLFSGGKSVIKKELTLNTKVRIEWLGNSLPDGTGKRVNVLQSTGKVTSIDTLKEYPYGVTIDGIVTIGYFKRDDLAIIE